MFFKNEETRIQIAVANYLKYKHPKVLFTISPSGNKLSYKKGAEFKAMGYRAGSPDMMIFEPRSKWIPAISGPGMEQIYHGLFVELKTKKGILSTFQQEFLGALDLRGYKTIVAYSYEAAIEGIEKYLKIA